MSRYLTPAKTCLLALIKIYCEEQIPPNAAIPILSFISSHLVPGFPGVHSSTDNEWQRKNALTLSDFRDLLEGVYIEPNHGDSPSKSIRNIWVVFLNVLHRVDSVDMLFQFFKAARDLVEPGRDADQEISGLVILSRTSIFGTFVRRMCLEFERLQFHDAMKLWRHFQQYHESMTNNQEMADDGRDSKSMFLESRAHPRRPGFGDVVAEEDILDIVNSRLDSPDQPVMSSSVNDMEALLEFQVDQMQKYGVRIPNEMRSHFQQVLQSYPGSLGLSHYARFLDAWYAGDILMSFENLHRYYDYAMHNRDRSHYQYALLNMAILQADFGSIAEAVNAMNEAISTARENKDLTCLNFSLNWLYFFRSMHEFKEHELPQQPKTGTRSESLAFLKEKAKESKMWSVVSSTLLNEAKVHLSLGDMPALAFDRIHESSFLNVHHSLTSVIGAQLMVQSSIFERIGVSQLATSYTRLLLDSYADTAPLDELFRARCRISQTLVNQGEHGTAEKQLELIDPRIHRNLKQSQFLTIFTKAWEFARLLRLNDFPRCEESIESLRSAEQTDYETKFQISMLEIDFLMKSEDYSAAFVNIQELALQCERNDLDVYCRIRLMCCKALLFTKIGRPQKGFTLALRATAAAHRLKLLPVLGESVSALGAVLIGLGEYQASVDLIDAVIYQIEEVKDLALTATLQATLADAYMGKAGQEPTDTQKRTSLMRLSYQWLQRAEESFHRLSDVSNRSECIAKLSLLCQLLDDGKEAAQWDVELSNVLRTKPSS